MNRKIEILKGSSICLWRLGTIKKTPLIRRSLSCWLTRCHFFVHIRLCGIFAQWVWDMMEHSRYLWRCLWNIHTVSQHVEGHIRKSTKAKTTTTWNQLKTNLVWNPTTLWFFTRNFFLRILFHKWFYPIVNLLVWMVGDDISNDVILHLLGPLSQLVWI